MKHALKTTIVYTSLCLHIAFITAVKVCLFSVPTYSLMRLSVGTGSLSILQTLHLRKLREFDGYWS